MVSEGAPSTTARRVAAYRLAFDRPSTPYGDPDADERLALDVAGSEPRPAEGEGLWSHLLGRTAFFDRVVIQALHRNVSQVVTIGAGYDGRALRYGKQGARWWEVDHPDTQVDKLARLERLKIPADNVTFVAIDLRGGGLASALVASGLDSGSPAIFLCEGVAVYLDLDVLEAVLRQLRSVSTDESRLAISLGARIDSRERLARRARFAAAAAAAGEPALNELTADDAGEVLAASGWRATDISDRAQQAGFVIAAPV